MRGTFKDFPDFLNVIQTGQPACVGCWQVEDFLPHRDKQEGCLPCDQFLADQLSSAESKLQLRRQVFGSHLLIALFQIGLAKLRKLLLGRSESWFRILSALHRVSMHSMNYSKAKISAIVGVYSLSQWAKAGEDPKRRLAFIIKAPVHQSIQLR